MSAYCRPANAENRQSLNILCTSVIKPSKSPFHLCFQCLKESRMRMRSEYASQETPPTLGGIPDSSIQLQEQMIAKDRHSVRRKEVEEQQQHGQQRDPKIRIARVWVYMYVAGCRTVWGITASRSRTTRVDQVPAGATLLSPQPLGLLLPDRIGKPSRPQTNRSKAERGPVMLGWNKVPQARFLGRELGG